MTRSSFYQSFDVLMYGRYTQAYIMGPQVKSILDGYHEETANNVTVSRFQYRGYMRVMSIPTSKYVWQFKSCNQHGERSQESGGGSAGSHWEVPRPGFSWRHTSHSKSRTCDSRSANFPELLLQPIVLIYLRTFICTL